MTGDDYADRAFVPTSTAGRNASTSSRDRTARADRPATDPGDGSAYSAAYLQADDYFSDLVRTVGYTDVVVTDLSGDVVYTAAEGSTSGRTSTTARSARAASRRATATSSPPTPSTPS